MATLYPGAIDDFAEASPTYMADPDATGRTHEERHDDVESAIEAVQTVLGANIANVTLAGSPGITLWAGTLAQFLGGADIPAGMAHPVALVDRLRSALLVIAVDLPDEERNIDPRRARVDARRIVAVEATRTLVVSLRVRHQGLLRLEVLHELGFVCGTFVFCHGMER